MKRDEEKIVAERAAQAVETMQRCVAFAFTGSTALPPECSRCLGVHKFGESCVDAATRHAKERGLL